MSRFLIIFTFLLSGCAALPENNAQPSYHLDSPSDSNIVATIKNSRYPANMDDDQVSVLLLEDGVDALVARLSLIEAAKSSIDLQYYLYYSDLSGELVTAALWRAALRGVRIRLLVDDMDLAGRDKVLASLSRHANFEIRIFNPFIRGKNRTTQFVTQFGSITRRMHNKTFTVDDSVSILGGRNIGDVYFAADPEVSFGDLDVAFIGPAVDQVSESFDLYWNHQLAYPIELLYEEGENQHSESDISDFFDQQIFVNKDNYYIHLLSANNLQQLFESGKIKHYQGMANVIYDHPDKIVKSRSKSNYHLAPQLAPYFEQIENELIIVSPYFVPGKEGLAFFQSLIDRGIHIKVLTNSFMSNDVAVVHAGYAKYRKKLLEMGVDLYEVDSKLLIHVDQKIVPKRKFHLLGKSKSSLHAKYFILDNKRMFIGSLNLDPRSFNENTEIGIMIDSIPLALDNTAKFETHINKIAFKLSLEKGNVVWKITNQKEQMVYHKEPYSSWLDRLVISVVQWLPGESQL